MRGRFWIWHGQLRRAPCCQPPWTARCDCGIPARAMLVSGCFPTATSSPPSLCIQRTSGCSSPGRWTAGFDCGAWRKSVSRLGTSCQPEITSRPCPFPRTALRPWPAPAPASCCSLTRRMTSSTTPKCTCAPSMERTKRAVR